MVNFDKKGRYSFQDLLEVVHILRSPGGCPWDQEQTHGSIRRELLEEAYEAAEAIDREDPALLREELGDVLLQVVFHADIAADAGRFTIDDVADEITKKMIYRHPHVFADAKEDSSESVLVSWEIRKRQEKHQQTTGDAMNSVARSLPALWRAEKIQKKAAKDGFDWPDIQGALAKLDEEVGELRQAVAEGGNVAEELGDVLFAAVKAGRFAGVDPEMALHETCEKVIRRYYAMEQQARDTDTAISQMSLEEMTRLWEQAKERS
ncbi:MAG: nucleoside triphosphate pyrophosphohydrolase [Ruminococcaceae bacterium]|nr:nucleoside triphosphate pyrophosphohydrolase [Oscillospiraceae bacterium]